MIAAKTVPTTMVEPSIDQERYFVYDTINLWKCNQEQDFGCRTLASEYDYKKVKASNQICELSIGLANIPNSNTNVENWAYSNHLHCIVRLYYCIASIFPYCRLSLN